MLNSKDKKTLLILTIISLAISAIACVPFTLAKLTQAELIIKYIVLPVIIAGLTIANYAIKFRNYRPAYRFPVLASYAPVFSYIIALAVNTLILLARSNQVYNLNVWIGLVAALALIIVGGAVLMHIFFKKTILFTKNEILVIDSLFVAVLAVDAIAFGIIAGKFVGLAEPFNNPSIAYIIAPIILCAGWLAFHIIHILKLFKSDAEYRLEDKAELIARYKKAYCDFYQEAYGDVIDSLFDFSAEKCGIEEIEFVDDEEPYEQEFEEEEQEVAEEEAPVEEAPVEVQKEIVVVKDEEDAKRIAELEAQLAELHETHSDKLEDLQEDLEDAEEEAEAAKAQAEEAKVAAEAAKSEAEVAKAEAEALKAAAAAEVAEAEAEAARKAALAAEKAKVLAEAKKAIKPSYMNLVNYASALEDDSVTVVANDKETQHKFYFNKKLFLVLTDSNVDYRLTFLASKEEAIDLIIENPKYVTKATSPKGPHWYKLVNKGSFEGEQLKNIIKNALEQQKVLLAEAEAEKERIKAEKAAAKKAAREAAKEAAKAE